MIIYLGADHRGFALKETIKTLLHDKGYEFVDKGAPAYAEGDDYPKYAAAVAAEVSRNPEARGIVISGSGVGGDIVANKYANVRSALAFLPDQVFDARHSENANVLSLAADFTAAEEAAALVRVFLTTPFSGGAEAERRIREIAEIETGVQ